MEQKMLAQFWHIMACFTRLKLNFQVYLVKIIYFCQNIPIQAL